MKLDQIKTAKEIKLKPNGIFDPVSGKSPYIYQRRGSMVMLASSRMVLGDDVGLGKTLETILMMSYIKAAFPETRFLIFTEKNALLQWQSELADFCPSLTSRVITAETHPSIPVRIKAMRSHGCDAIITNYAMLHKYSGYLKEGMGKRWVFIADEPDMFKNTDNSIHSNAFALVNGEGGAVRAYATTATIVGNRLAEAFGIFRVICPGLFPLWDDFEKEFCRTKMVRGRKKVVGYKNLHVFRERIKNHFYGRLQDDPEVMQELPDVITKDVEITLSEKQSWKVVEAMDRIVEMANGDVKQLQPLPALTLAQILCDDPRVKDFDIRGAKTEALIETLNGSLKGQRVVVYSKFRSVIDQVEIDLRKAGINPVRVTGLESGEEREASKQAFMSDGDNGASVLLMTKAGLRAMNLQKGGHFFFFDLPWAYDLYRQGIGRLKRTGSTHKKIGVYRYLAVLHPKVAAQVGGNETVDHHTLKVLLRKFDLWQAITGDDKEIDSTEDDVREIFDEVVASYKKV